MDFNKPDILNISCNIAGSCITYKEGVWIYFAATKTTKESTIL